MKDSTVVNINQGMVEGKEENGSVAFYGIPYAENAGRFKYAYKPVCWEGLRDATRPGPVFPQLGCRLSTVCGETEEEKYQSENAFTVNIWSKDIYAKRPVIIWIHGGNWVSGGNSLPWYNGSRLSADNDVVVVSVNYRLGALGGLYCPEISDGNLAIDDIVKAIKWTKKNIECFGGDSSNITLAGQSAGSWYITALLGNKDIVSIINNVILSSNPIQLAPYNRRDRKIMANLLFKACGVTSAKELLTLPAEDILRAEEKVSADMQKIRNEMSAPVFWSYADGKRVHKNLIKSAVKTAGGKVNVIAGSNFGESTPFVFQTPAVKLPIYMPIVKFTSNNVFVYPTYKLLREMNKAGSKTYGYSFEFESAQKEIHCCHCYDIPFFFNSFDGFTDAYMLKGMKMKQAEKVSKAEQYYISEFAENGDPNGRKYAEWPQYTRRKKDTLIYDAEVRVEDREETRFCSAVINVWKVAHKLKSCAYYIPHYKYYHSR